MECPFCEENPDIEEWDEPMLHHLVITVDANGKAHCHGPIEEPQHMARLLDIARSSVKWPEHKPKQWGKKKPAKEPKAKA